MTDLEKAELLKNVKSYLRITWDDEDEDIQDMINRAIGFFESIDINVNFVTNQQAKQLLLDRCRYIRNYATEEFANNFLSEILNLQMSLILPNYREDEEDGS